jgi:hypothetical protein
MMMYINMLYFYQIFLCLRCHPELMHMTARERPVVVKTHPIHHLYRQRWPRILLPWSMQPLINTRFLHEMAGNQFQQQGGRAYPQGPRETSYLDFSETRPPLFVKAEDPLEADEWVRVVEQKFGLIHCTETQKSLFAAQ